MHTERFEWVRTGSNPFTIWGAHLNPEPDFQFGSGTWLNLDWTLVRFTLGSGSNLGSEPDHGITTCMDGRDLPTLLCLPYPSHGNGRAAFKQHPTLTTHSPHQESGKST
jgi:hypothetical protein